MHDDSLTWFDEVYWALDELGGVAHLSKIYEIITDARENKGIDRPQNLQSIVRKELEYNSSDSETFQGRRDVFYSVNGIGKGVWGIRNYKRKMR